MSTALVWIGVVLLGGCGAMVRTAVGATVDSHRHFPFPLGTFTINVSGSFLAGLLFGAEVVGDAKLLVSTALIGAYSTFSTWMVDSERLARTGNVETAVLNVLGSLVAGLAVALLGKELGELLF